MQWLEEIWSKATTNQPPEYRSFLDFFNEWLDWGNLETLPLGETLYYHLVSGHTAISDSIHNAIMWQLPMLPLVQRTGAV